MSAAQLPCPHCGTVAPAGAAACAACGGSLTVANASSAEATAAPAALSPPPVTTPMGSLPPQLFHDGEVTATSPARRAPGPAGALPGPVPAPLSSARPTLLEHASVPESADSPATGGERNDDNRFRAGDRLLGHYSVVRQLGRGGMGTVYLARDDVSGQEVAVKVLPGQLARERDIRERFIQEARALASMDHPNIVPLITFAQENDDRFLVMKYIPGEALDARIRRQGVLAAGDARRVLRALLSALGYAHARGVIHRDVKPSNVVIEGDLEGEHRIFLVDFGIAKKGDSAERLTQTGMLMGTPQYMSPEQISGGVVDGRADLYAAGLVLFEMLTGRPPFDGPKTFQVLRAHVEQPVPDIRAVRKDDITEDLIALTYLLLRKNPNERPEDAHAAIALLDGTGTFPVPARAAQPSNPATPLTTSAPRPAFATAQMATPDLRALASARSTDPAGDLDDPSADEVAAVRPRRRGLVAALAGIIVLALSAGALWSTFGPGGLGAADTDSGPQTALAPTNEDTPIAADEMTLNLLLAKVGMALEKNDVEGARLTVEAALMQDPNNAKAQGLRVEVLLAAGAADLAAEAVAALKTRTDLEPAQAAALGEQETRLAALVERNKDNARKDAARKDDGERERRDRQHAAGTDRAQAPSRLSERALMRITSTTQDRIRGCYEEKVLVGDHRQEGEVVLKVTVEPSGQVKSVETLSSAFGVPAFDACIRDQVRRWRFPRFAGESDAFVHKFYFRPQA